jgi:V/A-type H+-transporting ATPase subunit A
MSPSINSTSEAMKPEISAQVVAVQDDLITLETLVLDNGKRSAITKNEVIYILPSRQADNNRQEWLKAEVLRIDGHRADAQVYESTAGVGIGDPIVQTRAMLSAELGPGLLGQVYDGLQNPLEELAIKFGTFLPRGVDLGALNKEKKWLFKPTKQEGDAVACAMVLGTVAEGRFNHKIMAPMGIVGDWKLDWIQQGSFTVKEVIAQISNEQGETQQIFMSQKWPIRKALGKELIKQGKAQRNYPDTPLSTTLRLIDTFFPIAKGGTGCIPGPFGAGKTVLQGLISRYSDVDIVIVVACGERAGEVVETIQDFPNMPDPKTGGTLMDRTIIICNTSSMPVAAREASIYMGITMAEYYQAMGFDVLLIADSTSRWAQAMRETSGRLEEIPGEEAFPAYLDSSIKNIYERAGVLQRLDNDDLGTFTMIGTVSPAGGNFEEPVTQSTLSTVKTFLGLSSERAYKRFYPAVDPLLSWSRYLQQLQPWFEAHLETGWADKVMAMRSLLERGEDIARMMQVTGEEGITTEDFILHQKSQLLDLVYLQQDAFDEVDVSVPMARQLELFHLLEKIIQHQPELNSKTELREFYTRLTGQLKNLNYASQKSPEYLKLQKGVETLIE